tara:strand:- start:225 stop:443 length:219 start_codon:yes stop_codon:yes gene_type:complete
MKMNKEYKKWLKENKYYYFVDCRKKNSNENWKRLKISNKYFYDTFYAHNLINELNQQDKNYEYKNYELVKVS